MKGYLIYHPKRCISRFGNLVVYHDKTRGNQDPYVWNKFFLHTYCHITQMSPDEDDINFWVSGDRFPKFTKLYCDLVFVVKDKLIWKNRNKIKWNDPLVDSKEAFDDHYKWASQHYFKKHRRFTLKANPFNSFQPQTKAHELIDILPFLEEMGLSTTKLRKGLRAGRGSCPFQLNEADVHKLYRWLEKTSQVKVRGKKLQQVRKNHPKLRSVSPRSRT